MIAIAAAILALATPAHAGGDEGTLQLSRRGAGPATVFVDGENRGTITGKKGMNLKLAAGPHVIWVSPDDDAFRVFCAGTLTTRPGTFSKVQLGPKNRCKGLAKGGLLAAPGLGARIRVTGDKGHVQVDGRDAGWTGFARFINVAPGSHAVRVTDDLLGKETRCKGRVHVAKGEVAVLGVDADGACTGFGEGAE